MIYYIVFLAIAFIAILELEPAHTVNPASKGIFPFYILVILTVLVSFRHGVGTDFYAYEELYYKSLSVYDDGVNSIELGYLYLSKLCTLLGMPFYLFLVMVCLCMYTLIYKSSRIATVYPCIALCVLYSDIFFYFHLSGIRQAIAMSFTLFAFKYLLEKKFLYFLLTVVLATMFHKTAIIFIIVYPLINYSKTKPFYVLCLSMIILMPFVLSAGFFDFLSNLGYFRAIDMYVSDTYNIFSLNNYIAGAVKRSFPLLALLYIFNSDRKAARELFCSPYVKVWFFGFCFFLSTYYSFPDVSVRLSTYFVMFNMFILPVFIKYFRAPLDKGLYIFSIFLYCGFSMYSYTTIPQYQYQFIDVF